MNKKNQATKAKELKKRKINSEALDADQTGRKMADLEITGRLLKYLKPFILQFILAFVLMIFAVFGDIVLPLLLGAAIDLLESPDATIVRIIYLMILTISVTLIYAFAQYNQTMILQKTGQKILMQIREDVFTKIENFSTAQVNQQPIGKLVTRVTNDTNALNDLYTNVFVNLIKNILTILFIIGIMLIVNIKMALITLSLMPLVGLFSFIFHRYSRNAHRRVRHSVSSVNAFLSENLSGMKITQVFNQENKKHQEFKKRNNELKRNSLRQILLFAIFRPSIYVLFILTSILVLYFSSKQIMDSGYTVKISLLIVFYNYAGMLFNPIQQLAEQFNALQAGFASSERIFEILDTPQDIVDAPDAIELTEIKGDIEFQHVWFCYEPDEWILQDVSFKVNAKETVAFVGATGSGKTTILSLIVRNYDIQKGRILIDGIDIKKIKISCLRSKIGQMLQDVFLFSGTIASNISLNDETVSLDEIKQACEYVNASKFIEKLPNQYHDEVRERGNNFSSGQRQLLSFARTILHKPSILILDEATANIDTETEVLIQDSLKKMMNIGTMLIVAHRLSTIQHADKIIVLRLGKIIESGTHQELIAQGGHYQELYQLQSQKLKIQAPKNNNHI